MISMLSNITVYPIKTYLCRYTCIDLFILFNELFIKARFGLNIFLFGNIYRYKDNTHI